MTITIKDNQHAIAKYILIIDGGTFFPGSPNWKLSLNN